MVLAFKLPKTSKEQNNRFLAPNRINVSNYYKIKKMNKSMHKGISEITAGKNKIFLK